MSKESITLDRITDHIEEYVGEIDFVIHDLGSSEPHIDVHVVKPFEERNFFTLVTSGMSEFEMEPPEGMEFAKRAELVMSLPAKWPLSKESFGLGNNEVYWPIEWLKLLPKYSKNLNSWLWLGHTIPNENPPEPFAENTDKCCLLIDAPILFEPEFFQLSVDENQEIFFLTLYPISKEETDFKLQNDSEKLFEKLRLCKAEELVDPKRKNLC